MVHPGEAALPRYRSYAAVGVPLGSFQARGRRTFVEPGGMTQPEKSKTRRSHLLALFGSALCAPLIGIAVMAMVRDGWFDLDRVYAAFPTSTVGLAAIISVIPLAVVAIWLADEL